MISPQTISKTFIVIILKSDFENIIWGELEINNEILLGAKLLLLSTIILTI